MAAGLAERSENQRDPELQDLTVPWRARVALQKILISKPNVAVRYPSAACVCCVCVCVCVCVLVLCVGVVCCVLRVACCVSRVCVCVRVCVREGFACECTRTCNNCMSACVERGCFAGGATGGDAGPTLQEEQNQERQQFGLPWLCHHEPADLCCASGGGHFCVQQPACLARGFGGLA